MYHTGGRVCLAVRALAFHQCEQKFGFIRRVDESQVATVNDLESVALLALCIHSDKGLTFKTTAFQLFHRGGLPFINLFDNTKFSRFTLPRTQHHNFCRD